MVFFSLWCDSECGKGRLGAVQEQLSLMRGELLGYISGVAAQLLLERFLKSLCNFSHDSLLLHYNLS